MIEKVRDVVIIVTGVLVSVALVLAMLAWLELRRATADAEQQARCAIPTLRLPECP